MRVALQVQPDAVLVGESLVTGGDSFDLSLVLEATGDVTGVLPGTLVITGTLEGFTRDEAKAAAGEALPTTDRSMVFRLTARDNNPGGGRVGDDTTTITSTTAAGAREIPNTSGLLLETLMDDAHAYPW